MKTSKLLLPALGQTMLLVLVLLVGCREQSEASKTVPELQQNGEERASALAGKSETRDAELNQSESGDETAAPHEPELNEPLSTTIGNENATVDSNPVKSDPSSATPVAQSKRVQIEKPTAKQIEEWAIPEFQKLELLTCFDGYGNSFLSSLETTPNGSHFVVGGEKLTLFAINHPERFELVRSELKDNLDNYILCADVSPDGTLIAAGEKGGMIAVWSLTERELINSWQAHDSRVSKLAFSRDSKSLATTSYDGKVVICEAKTGKPSTELAVAQQELTGLEFLSDQSLLVSGGAVRIWDIESKKRTRNLASGVFGKGLAISSDQSTIAHAGQDSGLRLFDVIANRRGARFGGHHGPIDYIAFSSDGKLVATSAQDQSIRIADRESGRPLQVVDTYGDRVVGLSWLPQGALLVASESGRIRLWGQRGPASAQGMIVNLPKQQPLLADKESRKPANSSILKQTMELRSFPRLPDAQANHEQFATVSYGSNRSVQEGMAFYRHVFEQAGWQETTPATETQPRLTFSKNNHTVMVSFSDGSMMSFLPSATKMGVSLYYEGNYDMRWLPRHSDDVEWEPYSSFGSASYRTTDDITDVEVQLLAKLHADGWTGYSRLNVSGSEEPTSRSMTFIGGGMNLNISLGYGASEELFVQASATLFNQSIPIPADSGFIEHDSSRALEMVANTAMSLQETVAFYKAAMPRDGWTPREHLHTVKDDRGWLSFIRGGQSVVVGLLKYKERGTRITVGNPNRSSWQLREPETIDPKVAKVGIEAADFELPKDANKVDYKVDETEIEVTVSGTSGPELVSGYIERMAETGWQKSYGGFLKEDYTLITLEKGAGELTFRARRQENNLTVLSISGDALLWTKPPPAPPKRVSYRRWLKRHRFRASLDRLEEFHQEMRKIPAPKPVRR